MKTNTASLQARIEFCQDMLIYCPDMWPGAKTGYLREITMTKRKMLGQKRKEAGNHDERRKK